MNGVDKIHAWKQTRLGLFVTGIAEAFFGYLFASKAIDSGSWWHYLLAFIFILGVLLSFVRAVLKHGKQ